MAALTPWTHITPCDDSLAGIEHDPHEYVHADQVFECDGEDHHEEIDGPDNDDWIHLAYERQAGDNPWRD